MQGNRKKFFISAQSIIEIGFTIIALIFSAIAASLLEFSLDNFKDPSFYGRTVVNFALMMFAYKIFKNITLRSSKTVSKDDPITPYQLSAIEYSKKTKYIKDNKLEHLVEKGTIKELERRRIEVANDMLAAITYDLTYDNIIRIEKTIDPETQKEITFKKIISVDEINEHCKLHRLSKRERKKLHKIINKIINNKIKYETFTAKDVLVDSELAKDKEMADKMKMDTAKYNLIETRNKTIMSLTSAFVMNAFIWDGWSWSIITTLIGQATLIISSIWSGIIAANNYLAYRKQIFDNRNYFLNSCGIDFPKN